jgi:hypothetical protein
MAAKLTRLTHIIAIQLHLVAAAPFAVFAPVVGKLVNTPSYIRMWKVKVFTQFKDIYLERLRETTRSVSQDGP